MAHDEYGSLLWRNLLKGLGDMVLDLGGFSTPLRIEGLDCASEELLLDVDLFEFIDGSFWL